jgi:hypothetical protein
LRIPRVYETLILRYDTLNDVQYSWKQPFNIGHLYNVTLFAVEEGVYNGGIYDGEPFLKLKVGWSRYYHPTGDPAKPFQRRRRALQVFTKAPEVIEAVKSLGLQRGDLLNLKIVNPKKVPGGYEFPYGGVTSAWVRADLFGLNGAPSLALVGHRDIAPAAVFDNESAEDPGVSASDGPISDAIPINSSVLFDRPESGEEIAA